MVVPLNGAECVAVVQAETHMIFCTISKQLLAGAPTCKKEKHVHAKVTKALHFYLILKSEIHQATRRTCTMS